MTTPNSAIVTVATQWRAMLEQKRREDGSTYWRRSDDIRDDALQAAIYKAHDGKLPNDHSYQYVVDALDETSSRTVATSMPRATI